MALPRVGLGLLLAGAPVRVPVEGVSSVCQNRRSTNHTRQFANIYSTQACPVPAGGIAPKKRPPAKGPPVSSGGVPKTSTLAETPRRQ